MILLRARYKYNKDEACFVSIFFPCFYKQIERDVVCRQRNEPNEAVTAGRISAADVLLHQKEMGNFLASTIF